MSHLGHGAAPKISRMIQYISVWYRYFSIVLIPQTAFEMKFKYLTSSIWYSSKQQPHTALSGTVMVCSGAALYKLQSLDADVSLFTKAFYTNIGQNRYLLGMVTWYILSGYTHEDSMTCSHCLWSVSEHQCTSYSSDVHSLQMSDQPSTPAQPLWLKTAKRTKNFIKNNLFCRWPIGLPSYMLLVSWLV